LSRSRNLVVSLVVVVCIVAAGVVYLRVTSRPGGPARIAPADDRSYFPVCHGLLSSAQRSIDVILYQSRFYFQYPGSKSNTMLTDLVTAAERGVAVRVVLEQADWNLENSEENRDVWNVLSESGVDLYFDPITTTSHSKLVIVDGKYVVLGSTNWSHYALDSNREANVVIESDKIAASFGDYFEDLIAASGTQYTPPFDYISADGVPEWEERYALIKDTADSGFYDVRDRMGCIFFGPLAVRVLDSPLEEIMAVDSLFFSRIAGREVRVLGRVETDDITTVRAYDVELGDTRAAMKHAFGIERSRVGQVRFQDEEMDWMDAVRVIPVPNEVYGREVRKLLRGAKTRIWVALLDARYYESRPATARRSKGPDEAPSLTNVILGELVNAAIEGVDVKLVCDMGWRGRPPQSKLDFLERLKAGGAGVFEDPADVTTHAKVLIVDDDFTVIGSTNWSYHALEENNETAVIVESPELNAHYATYIDSIIRAGTPYPAPNRGQS
jgi:HKD family nuclease